MQLGRYQLSFANSKIMAIVNVTPDSFSDGGELFDGKAVNLDSVLYRVEQAISEGADIIDIGGESTRPGAAPVSEQEEQQRVLPALEAIVARFDIPVSLDTSTASVIREGAKLGAALINDVRSLQRDGAIQAAASTGLPVCLMHMQGMPSTMQHNPTYHDVVAEIVGFLQARISKALAAGIPADKIIVDPGFGFGKQLAHNIALFKHIPSLVDMGYPVLVGVSRKTMVGELLGGREPKQRIVASAALALMAAQNGVSVIRTHDVRETADVLTMLNRIYE